MLRYVKCWKEFYTCVGNMVPTCVELSYDFLQNFVGNIPTLKFVRKNPTLSTRVQDIYGCAGTIPTNVAIGIISTSVGIILSLGTIPTLGEIIPTLYIMCKNLLNKIQQ